MANIVRIAAFAGSARRDSLNRKYLSVAADAVRAAGAEVTLLDLNAYPMPLYHGDLEAAEGLPAPVQALVAALSAQDGLLIASPEYNGMFTPLLKNTLDWCSRADADPFEGRTAAVISASPGAFGGARSLQLTQTYLTKLGCHVIPGQHALPRAHQAFDANGQLLETRPREALQQLAQALVETTRRLRR